MLVALDTSTRYAGVALCDERGMLAELAWLAGQNHSVHLLPNLQRLLELNGAASADLRAVGVALGPGSFNGLRVALATAKGLCLALDLPLLGVGTLAATAYSHRLGGRPICAVIDAGRGQTYGALFAEDDEGWPAEGYSGILPLAELLPRVERPTLFCGELGCEARQLIAAELGHLAILASPALAARRPGALAEMAWRRWSAGESDDLARTQPIYLRRSPAEQPRA